MPIWVAVFDHSSWNDRANALMSFSEEKRQSKKEPACFIPSFAGLVAVAGSLNPIPSRTRPLNSPAPMVLSLKAWKSRSLPGLPRTLLLLDTMIDFKMAARNGGHFLCERVLRVIATSQCFLEFRADQSAAMRRRNAFGFSANRRPASRAADFKCASRRALISGVSRDRHGASGSLRSVKLASTARS